jgi:hypothetical protein
MFMRTWFALLGLLVTMSSTPTLQAFGQGFAPAGTILNVRTTQTLTAEYAQPGMRLVGIVDDPVAVDGRIVIPRGAQATLEVVGVEESSNLQGRDRIALVVRSLHMNGRVYPVSSNYVELRGRSEGKRAAKKIGAGAGIGAAIGGLLGGGSGAAWGALAGGGTGAAIAGSGKKNLVIPAETRLQFQIMGGVPVR